MEEIQPRAKSRRTRAMEILLVLLISMIGAAILFPTGSRSRENVRRSSCQSNLKQVMLSVKQYAADYDGITPPVGSGPRTSLLISNGFPTFGWVDALQPYRFSARIFQCLSEKIILTKTQQPQTEERSTPGTKNREPEVSSVNDQTRFEPQLTDYWLNARMAEKREANLSEAPRTITLGDGDSGDARSHLVAIPHRWAKDENSPLHRHLNGANFAFADGHVKWLSAGNWVGGLDCSDFLHSTFRLQPLAMAAKRKAAK